MGQEPEVTEHLLSNKLYDRLKLCALVIFPAFGTFYFALAGIWGLPWAEEVVSTIVAVDTFLGVLIKIGDVSYNVSDARFDGKVSVSPNGDGTGMVNLDLNEKNPEAVTDNKDELILKVVPPPE